MLPSIILIVLLGAVSTIVFVIWYWASPENLNVGYQPEQPIPYSHKLHVSEIGIDCRYCHYDVETSKHASVPPTEVCMNCHDVIKKDSPAILKLRESYAEDKPIEWVKVNQMPDYAYFDHSAHVNKGVSCVSCHGRVDQMDVVHQVEPLSMGFCLDCHRNPEPHLRPKDKVTDLGWTSDNQAELGKYLKEAYHVNPREDCSACHR